MLSCAKPREASALDSGLSYLNLYVKHLGQAGFAVGGLLGEDDHADVITPSEACVKRLSLIGLRA